MEKWTHLALDPLPALLHDSDYVKDNMESKKEMEKERRKRRGLCRKEKQTRTFPPPTARSLDLSPLTGYMTVMTIMT